MKRRKNKSIGINLIILLLVFNLFQFSILAVDAASDEEVFAKLNDREFKEEVNLGMPVTGAVLTSAVFGVENGRQIAYTTANGGMFSAVDVVKNEVLFTAQLEGISAVWSHSVASDGTVYIAGLSEKNVGTLWSYSPEDKTVTNHGVADATHQFWSSTTDDDGNVYIGTYKEGEGKIFKYDKSLNEFVDFGKIDMEGDSSYVRSLAYHEGYIYAGLGVTGNVYKINAADPTEKENITKNVPELIGAAHEDIGFAYDMSIVGDYLAVRFNDTAAILFYDIIAEHWVSDVVIGKKNDGSEEDFGSFGFTQLAVHNNKTYVINDRKILEVDVETLETRETDIAYPAGWRGAIFADFGEADEEDMRLVTFQRNGELLSFNIEDKTRESFPLAISGDQPMDLHNLGLGPDGNLYMTTYPGGPKGAQYNTKTGKFQSYSQGQAEGMIAGNGTDMFFGIYTGAVIQKMNTETLAMETLFNLNDEYEQDRPYIMKFEDDKLLIGTIPDYQKLGGTLTIYDPESKERETYRNVVQDHSIVGLAMKDGKIFGSTTIRGGLDIPPTADNAKMFVWDVDGKRKITDFEINLPGLGKSPMISGLTFDDEGLLWGAVDGHLFAMNPDTYEIVKHKNIYPNIVNRGMWRPVHIHFGDDGLLYTDIGGKLVVVDPKSAELDHVSLIDSGDELSFMELAYDAEGNQNIYFINHKNFLKMIPVIDGGKLPVEPEYETANVPMTNPGFEEAVNANGSIPGWSSLFEEVTANVSFEVTNELTKSGTSSLKITDKSPDETVFVQSDLIPVESGVEYTGSVEMYLEDGSASFFLRYFDEEGKQVGVDKDGVNIIHVRSGHGNWQTVKAVVEAPEGAKFARLFAGTSKFFQTTGAYYDDFKLTYEKEMEPGEPDPEPELINVTDVEVLEIVEADYGTELANVTLPEQVLITLAKGTDVNVNVTWDQGNPMYNELNPGTYTFTGTIDLTDLENVTNTENLQATIDVIVKEKEETPVEPEYETVNLPVVNPGFEEALNEDGSIPGWSSLFTLTDNVTLGVSDEQSKNGANSLKITDDSQTELVYGVSDAIEIEAGIEYTSNVNVFLQDGSASFMIRFYADDNDTDLANAHINKEVEGESLVHIRSGHGEWQQSTVSAVAPEGAKYARLIGGASNWFTTSGVYFDDFQLTYEKEVEIEEPVEVVEVEQFDNIEVEFGTTIDELSLPESVEITLSNDEVEIVPVAWDEGNPKYNGEVAGTYAFTGTLDLSELEGVQNELVALLGVIVLEDSTEPTEPTEPTENNDQVIVDKDNDNGEKLPKTATSIFNLLFFGILLLVGAGFVFIRKHKIEQA